MYMHLKEMIYILYFVVKGQSFLDVCVLYLRRTLLLCNCELVKLVMNCLGSLDSLISSVPSFFSCVLMYSNIGPCKSMQMLCVVFATSHDALSLAKHLCAFT